MPIKKITWSNFLGCWSESNRVGANAKDLGIIKQKLWVWSKSGADFFFGSKNFRDFGPGYLLTSTHILVRIFENRNRVGANTKDLGIIKQKLWVLVPSGGDVYK